MFVNVPHFSECSSAQKTDTSPQGAVCSKQQHTDLQSSSTYLPIEVYARSLDALVITCVDLVFIHNSAVLLGKRANPPRQGWWVIGGRMIAGESPLQTAQRKASEEAGLSLTGDRFHCSGVYSTQFAHRHHRFPPGPLHSVNLTYSVLLTAAEAAAATLTVTEYEDQQWMTLEEVAPYLRPEDPMDQALHQVLNDALWLTVK